METVVRVAVLYVFLMLALRVLGKREFSELTPFDLVTLILIPDIVLQQVKWVILEPDGRISVIPVRQEELGQSSERHRSTT